jgi:mono/diheme cytochrome c family protein
MTNRLTGAVRPDAAPGLGAALALLVGCSSAAPPQTEPAPPASDAVESVADGLVASASFTLEQVDRGQYEFSVVCKECHSTSEFRGQNFEFAWRRRTAWDFYRTVTQTMPENAPGSLMDEQYVDVIAYILEMNGFEPGDAELPATKTALEQFPMDGAPTR